MSGPSHLTEGTKFDEEKTARYDLLAPIFLHGTARILGFGAVKYDDRNWEKGIKYHRVFRACLGHLWAWWNGEDLDPETNEPHLWHAACCLMFLMHYEFESKRYKEYDDRPRAGTKLP